MFPSYQAVNAMDGSGLAPLDLSNKWVYLLGDSTMAQLHEQMTDYMDTASVRALSLKPAQQCGGK